MIEIYSLISLAFLLFLVLVPYNELRVSRTRQVLFEIRDRMFLDAAHGRVSFDSRAYGFTRVAINGMIRFAHRMSLSRCVTAVALIRSDDQELLERAELRAFNASSEEDRVLCKAYLKEANEAMALHVLTSPIALVILVPILAMVVVPWLTGASLATYIVNHGRRIFARLDAMAFEEGKAALTTDTAFARLV